MVVAYLRQLTDFISWDIDYGLKLCLGMHWPDLIPTPPPCRTMSVAMGRNQTHNVGKGEGRTGLEGGEEKGRDLCLGCR